MDERSAADGPVDGTDPMTIGAFSARTRLSAKALRRYDGLGLLAPAEVDPTTGYRRYTLDQVDRARRIARLRQAGMPLARITAVVDLDASAAAVAVAAWWCEVEAELDERRALVRILTRSLTERGSTVFDISTRDVPEQKLLCVQRHLTAPDIGAFVDEGFGRLTGHLATSGVNPQRPSLMIFHGVVDDDSDGPLELAVPFDGPVESTGDLVVRVEPAHREAFTAITRAQWAFPAILEAYDAVACWVDTTIGAHHRPLSCREVYHHPVDGLGDDDLVCDVAFPFVAAPADHTG